MSVVYQTILKAVKNINEYTGLSNLVTASIVDTIINRLTFTKADSIFKSGHIKDAVSTYFNQQKTMRQSTANPFQINLYVPETLGKCLLPNDCVVKSLKEYIDLTGDQNWTGLLIYQHKTQEKCPYPIPYKCKGTTASGLQREQTEGKQYSADAWYISYRNGKYAVDLAPQYRFRLHNCIDCISYFKDLSNPPLYQRANFSDIQAILTENKCEYVDGRVRDKDDTYKIVPTNPVNETTLPTATAIPDNNYYGDSSEV